MQPFQLYERALLPKGFEYPELLAQFSRTGAYPTIEPWWFIDAGTKAGDLFYSVRTHDGRNLVPFAKMDDDLACFDGDDASRNPAVHALVLDESGRSYSFRDFAEWLLAAGR